MLYRVWLLHQTDVWPNQTIWDEHPGQQPERGKAVCVGEKKIFEDHKEELGFNYKQFNCGIRFSLSPITITYVQEYPVSFHVV